MTAYLIGGAILLALTWGILVPAAYMTGSRRRAEATDYRKVEEEC